MMVVAVASPSPATGTSAAGRHRDHPPYKEMILRAVEFLKDRKGSSRVAISKFIASTYSDLPPAHDALLACHLRRLKSKGVLLMVKHSYKLAAVAKPDPKPRGRPRKIPASNPAASAETKPGSGIVGAKRKPGRPPKAKQNYPVAVTEKRKPGRPPKMKSGVPLAATERRKPGRPPKARQGVPLAATERRKPGRPPKAKEGTPTAATEKRKPGRPRSLPLGAMEKRKPGRPGKLPATSSTAALNGKRKRGRPPKGNSVAAAAAASEPNAEATPLTEKRKRGRPKKMPLALLDQAADGAEAVLPTVKRRGRPPKIQNEPMPGNGEGISVPEVEKKSDEV